MGSLDFSRTKILNNIPSKKIDAIISGIKNSDTDDLSKNTKIIAVNRFAESNIPIEYWKIKMEKDFHGDERLLNRYNQYTSNLSSMYDDGKSICFAGNYGLGKTFTACSILKQASLKGFSCLYSTMVDVTTAFTSDDVDKFSLKRELLTVDFLFIDELDYRFFGSENARELYAKLFESIIRGRLQNKLPTLMATNSPNIKENFLSVFKDSLGSLFNKIEIFSVLPGKDFRSV